MKDYLIVIEINIFKYLANKIDSNLLSSLIQYNFVTKQLPI